ncbi:MAG: hypothetical protein ABI862_19165 [Ilumatobacteraceae bacterium]
MTTLANELRSSLNADQLHPLHIYLRDHEAAAAGGLRLAHRCWKSNRGTAYADELHRLATDVRADRDALRQICSDLGVRLSRLGRAVACAGVLMGRLKLNGRLFRYSPLSRVIELEALSSGVMAKRRLWESLLSTAETDRRLDREALVRHAAEANEQLKAVGKLHDAAAHEAFG